MSDSVVKATQADAVREALKRVENGGVVHVFGKPDGEPVGVAFLCEEGHEYDPARKEVEVVYHCQVRPLIGDLSKMWCSECRYISGMGNEKVVDIARPPLWNEKAYTEFEIAMDEYLLANGWVDNGEPKGPNYIDSWSKPGVRDGVRFGHAVNIQLQWDRMFASSKRKT